MKKIITLFALMLCLCATAQEAVGEYMYIHRNNNTVERILLSEVDSVTFVEVAPAPQYEAIDLGLSVKWASCNVGANAPEEYGGYFAWGEISPKSSYSASNSVTYGMPMSDISGNAQYDVARANWGGNWRMPTYAEIDELLYKCSWKWTTQNGVNGYRVTGPNGNSIFLPAAGYRGGPSLDNGGPTGTYWSSTPRESYSSDTAYDLYFNSNNYDCYHSYRNFGKSVRPVLE